MAYRTYKFRLYPNKEQAARLDNSLNLLRDLYNAALQERRDAWRFNRVRVTCFDQTKQVPAIRSLNVDYLSVQARVMHQTLRQLDKAFQAFYRRVKIGEKAGFPRFKGKESFNVITYNQTGFGLSGNRVHLAFVGDLKAKVSLSIAGTVKQVQAKREGSKWYAIISCDNVPDNPLPATGEVIGIDVGIESFATLSDGTQIENNRFYESTQKQLRVAQRRVARRKKGSNGRKKAVAILRNIHQKIQNQRSDFQHKVSTHLVKSYDLIAVEKLNVKGLAKGILSKQITDVGWYSFTQKLSYKAASARRMFIEVNPAYTSQDCSRCGNRVKKDLKVRVHNCDNCGLSLHRDWNAALNILAAGQAVQTPTYRVTDCVV